MFELGAFIAEGHRKVIGHYRRLGDSTQSASERERVQRMDEEEDRLRRFSEQLSYPTDRAA